MSEKTFLLGVGCQKGGTTWLHRYLDSHPQCNLGFQKEYHFFDSLYLEACSGIYRNRQASLAALLQEKQNGTSLDAEKLDAKILRKQRLVSFYDDPTRYAAYFDEIYAEDENTRLVGDITPSYSALNRSHFTQVRNLLEARGFTVKVIFLMRDPIERIFSANHMEIARKKRRGKETESSAEQLFLRKYQDEKVVMRTRYENTVPNIEASFAAENVLFGFYETLFNDKSINTITDFLGIDFIKPNIGKRIHAAKKKERLSATSIGLAREFYTATYEFCSDRFGREFIAEIWKHAYPDTVNKSLIKKVLGFAGI